MIDEGYVKYHCNWIYSAPVNISNFTELNQWRSRLYDLGLIGEYDNGIGFGNLSIRDLESGLFIISGTQTGNLPILSEQHYTRVTSFNLEQNSLTCEGSVQASSESLTHAAIYEASPAVQAIIHVHHFNLWKRLIDKIPTTAKACPYGTPEMAREIFRLFREDRRIEEKILVMGGHEEGIISFGETLEEAGKILLKYYEQLLAEDNFLRTF